MNGALRSSARPRHQAWTMRRPCTPSDAASTAASAPRWLRYWRIDRKSTRLTPVTNAHLVCRLLLEKKKNKECHNRCTRDKYRSTSKKTKQRHKTYKGQR